jgi:hypothetical protein
VGECGGVPSRWGEGGGVAQEVGKASQGPAGVAQEVRGGGNPDCLLVVDPPWPEVAELGATGARGRPREMQDAGRPQGPWEAGGGTAATDACGGSSDGK